MVKKLDSIIKKIFGFFKIDISDSKTAVISQFVKFGIVGVSNTLLSYGIYLLVLFMMKPLNISWDAYVGSVVSFFLSVLWSFFWNNKYVFKSDKGERNLFKALIKTYISYGFTGFILANILLFVWIDLLNIPKTIAPLISLLITVPANFLLNKFWAFRTKKTEKDQEKQI